MKIERRDDWYTGPGSDPPLCHSWVRGSGIVIGRRLYGMVRGLCRSGSVRFDPQAGGWGARIAPRFGRTLVSPLGAAMENGAREASPRGRGGAVSERERPIRSTAGGWGACIAPRFGRTPHDPLPAIRARATRSPPGERDLPCRVVLQHNKNQTNLHTYTLSHTHFPPLPRYW